MLNPPHNTSPPPPEHTITGLAKISIQHLSLSFKQQNPILKDISFDIPPGKIICLIGPSGSGKSTLLRCLNRLWEPGPGSIFLDQVDITSLDVLVLRRKVGMLLQTAALFEGTVADNIAYGPKLQGQNLSQKSLNNLLEMVSLSQDIATQSADALSGGQAQRVSLARTLANKPQVLLLDEPTSALDPAATQQIEETILRLRDELGLTVVWVSHAFEQVQRVADFVVLLVAGEVLEMGTAEHLSQHEHQHLIDDFAAGKIK